MLLLLLLIACGDPEPAPLPRAETPSRPGPPSAVPDMASSWRADLAVEVPALAAADCPDADGDGFPDAFACPATPTDRADCDDSDPAVTPATERFVAPGPFVMGSQSDQAGADEAPVHIVWLSAYCLDVAETTTADFAAWLEAEGRAPESDEIRGITDGAVTEGRERHTVEGLTPDEAAAYCASRGEALPTEAQWEKAARGGCERHGDATRCDPEDLRPFPWGVEAPTCALANHRVDGKPCHGDTVLAGTTAAGPYGHTELAGNAWEIVDDWWHPGTYTADPRTDPGGPASGTFRVLRGGGWSTFSTNMRVANRFTDALAGSAPTVRCARPSVPARTDPVEPMRGVAVRGVITRGGRPLSGDALHVTAFDAADADPATGMLAPGRSPVAEIRLTPSGATEQPFEITLPSGRSYLLSAALDDGSGDGGPGQGGMLPAAASGGLGQCSDNPVAVGDEPREGLTIEISAQPRPAPPRSNPR